MKIFEKIKLKIGIFTAVKYCCILHGRVIIMCWFFSEYFSVSPVAVTNVSFCSDSSIVGLQSDLLTVLVLSGFYTLVLSVHLKDTKNSYEIS